MGFLLRLAVRNVARHPWRSSATVLGVGLGIAAVLSTLSVGANVKANIQSALEAAAGKTDLLVTPGASGRSVFDIDEVASAVAASTGVAEVFPVLHYRAEPVREVADAETSVIPGVDTGFQLSGRITSEPDALPVRLSRGTVPEEGSFGIALAGGFATSRGIELGDVVGFATQFGEIPFEVTGILDEGFGFASTNGGRVGVVHLSDLQEAVHLTGRASFLEVHLDDEADLGSVKTGLEDILSASFTVTLPATSGNFATGLTDTLQSGLSILAATLLVLGAFMAYNTFSAAVVERTREFALLRTVCLRRSEVQRLALIEAGVIGLLGVVAGVVLGVGLAYTITRFNAWALGFEFRRLVIPVPSVLVATILGIVAALAAGWLPARAASETPPMVANRAAQLADGPPARIGTGWFLLLSGIAAALIPWAGIGALVASAAAMALLFTGLALLTPSMLAPVLAILGPLLSSWLGPPGKLGAGMALRNAGRNGVAIGSVVLGLGLTIGVGSMVAGINRSIGAWVDTTVVGDLFVTSPVSFPQEFEQQALSAIPELNTVSGVGIRVVRFQPAGAPRGRSVALVLVDPERFNPATGFGSFQYIQKQGDNRSGYEALRAGTSVLAANTIKEKYDVELGDLVELRTVEGFQSFPIAGVVVDFTGGGETFVASIDDLELFGGGSPDLYVMTVEAGTDPSQVRQQLLETFPQLHLDITLNQAYRAQIQALASRSFTTTNALLVLAVFVAALGVANTLGMNLANRQHEVAVLRTLGLTKRGVAAMITAEGIVVILVGTILGIGAGLLLSRVITVGAGELTGFAVEAVYPWRLVVLALLSSPVVGLVAAFLPARRASNLAPALALASGE